MCMFSAEPISVTHTKIFARVLADGRQGLVYEMRLDAAVDLAMVLPIPVPAESAEDAVEFIDLSKIHGFFSYLDLCFPQPENLLVQSQSLGMAKSNTLAVHEVGDFIASFIPTIADFSRLDPRFRMPNGVWSELGRYDDFGFAVFQLAAPKRSWWDRLRGRRPTRSFHPMGFAFPRRDASIFFPTVHVHDGRVEARAAFDHTFYLQVPEAAAPGPTEDFPALRWERSDEIRADMTFWEPAQGLVDFDLRCYRTGLAGYQNNVDLVL